MRDVVTQQLEALVIEKMLDIAPLSREEIIDAKDLVPSRQELLAEMGAKKSGASGNQYSPLEVHVALSLMARREVPDGGPWSSAILMIGDNGSALELDLFEASPPRV